MTDISTLLADLETLKAARRKGAVRVKFEGQEVEYRSDEELAAAIAAIETELGGGGARNVVVRGRKGWA